ncbi:hypothetical protein [Kyrpidia spormannii]|uniref:Uncharacterized protein n=2 Tax=Kyrpidia spormannii TaxID=2055160 RepID=A0A6F9EE19_9BACL|nr:hypothetical protein [Kyrpidia spormannii]CAB3394812.1 conserved protein of unknown function [Kyrpidia spormannii]CAB3395779.1 conserved protein of unknown function [Kyrpidia spormannii]
MAYAIFWTLVVIAVAIALGYFFVNPRDEDRGRSEARWKDRSALDTEFSQWLGLDDEDHREDSDRSTADSRRSGDAQSPNDSFFRGTSTSGRSPVAVREFKAKGETQVRNKPAQVVDLKEREFPPAPGPAGIHQKTKGETDGTRATAANRALGAADMKADARETAWTEEETPKAADRAVASTDQDAARATAKAALGESAALLAMDDAPEDDQETKVES